jgi:glycosyltransferase involved in cell wall biosynthesis
MHVLLVTSYYLSPESPITGIFFHEQALALHKAGHKVGVLVTPRLSVTRAYIKRKGIGALRSTILESDYFTDFPVYRMHFGWFPRPFPFVVAPLVAQAGFKAFEQYVKAHGRPDVIHAHNIFYGGSLGARLSEKYQIPMVLTEYSSSFLEGLVIFPGQPRIIQYTLRASKANLVCGSSLIAPLHKYAPEQQIEMIGCVVDTDFFTPSHETIPDDPFKFVVIAQLKERRKGFDILLKAFHQAFQTNERVQLYIRGHGPLRGELDRLIAELGLENQISFLTRMTKEELRDLIRQSHCLVSSSLVETFGVSVAEAISCGKPVVSTISGGPEDFVTERSGILIPAGDVDALAQAMRRMVDEYDRYEPDTVRADVVERFSEQVYVSKLETIYSTLGAHEKPGL